MLGRPRIRPMLSRSVGSLSSRRSVCQTFSNEAACSAWQISSASRRSATMRSGSGASSSGRGCAMSNLSPDYGTGRTERPPCRRRQWARVRGQQDGAGNTPVFRVKAPAGQDHLHGCSRQLSSSRVRASGAAGPGSGAQEVIDGGPCASGPGCPERSRGPGMTCHVLTQHSIHS